MTRRWLFADQLGPHFLDAPDQPVLLIESKAVFRRRRFHRQKAHLVLSALRHRALELGDQARFVRSETYAPAVQGDTSTRSRTPSAPGRPRRRGRRGLPVRRAARRPRPRLGAPHPAADGARQLRDAAWLAARRDVGLVPPGIRRRLRVGDDGERDRDEPVRRHGPDEKARGGRTPQGVGFFAGAYLGTYSWPVSFWISDMTSSVSARSAVRSSGRPTVSIGLPNLTVTLPQPLGFGYG